MATALARFHLMRRTLTGREWARLGGFATAVLALHVIGWLTLIAFVAPKYAAIGLGTGVTAYSFGLRHAFDADHISAIDNTTRKLMADGQRPLGVGFFFSLGHSTIVFGLALALTFAAKSVAGQIGDKTPVHNLGGYIGTTVSGVFLYLIALLNLVILVGILRVFVDMRRGRYDEVQLEQQLQNRGFMNRFFGPVNRAVQRSWQMYPVGLLFGLGFDTATEVGLLALTAGAASAALPWYAVLCLPVLFAAGMSLMDTADGAFMSRAYSWAFSNPVRKVFYNLTMTGLSVFVALFIGLIEVAQIIAQTLNFRGAVWDALKNLNFGIIGGIIVAAFIVSWAGAFLIYRSQHIEERWSAALRH